MLSRNFISVFYRSLTWRTSWRPGITRWAEDMSWDTRVVRRRQTTNWVKLRRTPARSLGRCWTGCSDRSSRTDYLIRWGGKKEAKEQLNFNLKGLCRFNASDPSFKEGSSDSKGFPLNLNLFNNLEYRNFY